MTGLSGFYSHHPKLSTQNKSMTYIKKHKGNNWSHMLNAFIMRPSSLGGGRILRRTLSVCLSVCPSVPYIVATGYFFSAPLASRRAT